MRWSHTRYWNLSEVFLQYFQSRSQLIDDYFDLKQRVTQQKKKLDELASKFQELKKLAIKYKEGKDKEINKLNDELDKFKKTVEESNILYESMLDKTTESLEKILLNTESISKIQ